MKNLDIMFLSETHCSVKALGDIKGFTVFGDPSFPMIQKHGGAAVFVRDHYAQFVKDLRFSKSTVSFTHSNLPNLSFMDMYI